MLIALATNPKDVDHCADLLSWIGELQASYAKHRMLIVGAFTLDESTILELVAQARKCGFSQVISIRAREEPDNPWPEAANYMFRLASDWVKDFGRCPWLWIEGDSIPMRSGWLDEIEAEYATSRKPFMGTLYEHPWRHLNGIAVYPENIRKFNPLIFNTEFSNLPFDTVRPDLTLQTRNAHITKLIHRSLEDPQTNTPHTFKTMDDLSIIPPECALFHGCKDQTLIARLREKRNGFSHGIIADAEPLSLKDKLIGGIKRFVGTTTPYYHAGNLGDVVYALPAIKAVGGGDLIIGPQQRQTALCSVPIDKNQFAMFEPLLKVQPYLSSVRYSEKYPSGCRDLNHFRNIWTSPVLRKNHDIQTLCQAHFMELGVLDRFAAQEQESWLTCGKPIETGKLICHRSPRYNSTSTGPESFPWQRIVDKHHEDMIFVGLESEHDTFCKNFGKKISFWRVRDFLELANLIAGGREFYGNQSFPLSVALGLGKTVTVEAIARSPDCRFYRNNYHDQLLETIVI